MIFLTSLEGVHRFDITLRTLMPLMPLVSRPRLPSYLHYGKFNLITFFEKQSYMYEGICSSYETTY